MTNFDRFINRELSWLSFNNRVLYEAENSLNPILERLKFLSISASNLDEFYMVRVAGLMAKKRLGIESLSDDGLTPVKQLELIKSNAVDLIKRQDRCWEQLQSSLSKNKINIYEIKDLDNNDIIWLKNFFKESIFPLLTPLAIDPLHSFPFIPNGGLSLILKLEKKKSGEILNALVPIPNNIDRFILLPGDNSCFLSLESLIVLFYELLFPDFKLSHSGLFRIIRDSELALDEGVDDLLHNLETALKLRRTGYCISITFSDSTSKDQINMISHALEVAQADIFIASGMVGLRDIELIAKCERPDLKFPAFSPRFPERIKDFDGDCFAAINTKDIIVHHPYESFDSVLQFLKQAVRDSKVLSIKQTLYRTSKDSPIVYELIEAAEAGKSVTAMVELKARFDEEANIRWARDLESAGVNVVFGLLDLKAHAKLCLITRREGMKIKSYAHFGTGNYHPANARIYTDLSLFTADPSLCSDVNQVFNYMTGYAEPQKLEKLIIAPISLRKELLKLINQEIFYADSGRPGRIWAKMNSLVDPEIIDKLYEASQSGVEIHLIVRGVCCLRPGIKNLSENITVKSIIGRFLEHARIYAFGNGSDLPSRNAKVYISSADWMPRNLISRVETLVPIENETVHQQVLDQILVANINDYRHSWFLDSNGDYERRYHKSSFSAHEFFMNNPSLSGRGKSLHGTKKELNKLIPEIISD